MSSPCPACGTALLAIGHCPTCLARLSLLGNDPEPEAGRALAGYELYEEIGRGGMGIVYRARQCSLGREVAVKMLLAGEFASPDFVRRFQQEAEIAARLRHPGVVMIHEIGESEGQLFYAMELVAGRSLAELARGVPLPAREAATLLAAVADAVHYAHGEGVLHRDLKPANILIDTFGQPKVADFGLARLEANPGGTLSAQVLGSPPYVAPEVADGRAATVASDIYALGSVLYHLLTGRAPFHGENVQQIFAQVRAGRIIPPRRLNPAVPRDLEAVCLQALEHSPTRRYPDAAGLAADLRRWLAGEPVTARQAGPIGRAWRWAARRPALAAALVVAAGSLLALATVFVLSRERLLATERRRAEAAESLAGERLRIARLAEAARITREHKAGHRAAAFTALQEAWKIAPGEDVRNAAIESLSVPDVTFAPAPTETAFPSERPSTFEPPIPHTLRAAHAARRLTAVVGEHRELSIWDTTTGALRLRFVGHEGRCHALAFNQRGNLLASAGSEGTLRLWDTARGEEVLVLDEGIPEKPELRWSADDRHLALAAQRALRFHPAVLQVLVPVRETHVEADIRTVDFSADGRWLVATAHGGSQLWSLPEGLASAFIPATGDEWTGARFAPDHEVLWLSGWNTALRRHTLASATTETFRGAEGCTLAEMSADGATLALLSNFRGGFLLRPPAGGAQRWLMHPSPFAIGLSPDGQTMATSSFKTDEVRVWSAAHAKPIRDLPAQRGANLRFTPDGRLLRATWKNTLAAWDTTTWQPQPPILFPERIAKFDERDGLLAIASARQVYLRPSATPNVPLAGLPLLGVPPRDTIKSVAFSADGRRLAVHTATGAVLLWDLAALRQELARHGWGW